MFARNLPDIGQATARTAVLAVALTAVRDRVRQRPRQLESPRRVLQIDQLLVVTQLEAVESLSGDLGLAPEPGHTLPRPGPP